MSWLHKVVAKQVHQKGLSSVAWQNMLISKTKTNSLLYVEMGLSASKQPEQPVIPLQSILPYRYHKYSNKASSLHT